MQTPRRNPLRRLAVRTAPVLVAGALVLGSAGVAAADGLDGPDVASWQHPRNASIDWFAVRGAGQDFALVKATEGLNYVNPFYVGDSVGIKAAGLVRGTYHFARPALNPEAQATFYAATALGNVLPGDLPPVLDLEDAGGLNPAQLQDWTRRFLNTVQQLSGRQPIIYTYPYFWRTAMGNTREFANYPLWIAHYGVQRPDIPGGWNRYTFWQTTSKGRLPGIQGDVDLNVFGGSPAEFAWISRGGFLAGLPSGSAI